jgi:hypothetical protein
MKVIVLKKYKKSCLVAAYGKVAIMEPETGEILGHEYVKGEAGILNINVDTIEEGQLIVGVKFTDEKVLTPAGIEKQKARLPIEESDYLPFKRVVCE